MHIELNGWGQPPNKIGGETILDCGVWFIGRIDQPGATRILSVISQAYASNEHSAQSLVPKWIDISDPCRGVTLGQFREQIFDARGWPIIALKSRVDFLAHSVDLSMHPAKPYRVKISESKGGLILGDHNKDDWMSPTTFWTMQLLPLTPVWPGFAINTIFYAAILWLLTLGPFTARRMIRHKRGRCIKCGYDLRNVEHEKCPECGCHCPNFVN